MKSRDNMRVEFNIIIEEGMDYDAETLVNKPIAVNEIPVGVITDAKLDESGLYYNCLGVIWDRYIHIEHMHDNKLNLQLSAIHLR